MLQSEAVLRFADKQKRLLRRTYDEAWKRGADSYEPDGDPDQTSTVPKQMAITGLTGAALLAVLRRYPYEPPSVPDSTRRAVALAPAFQGINRMTHELSQPMVSASPADWADSNAWRLDAGGTVAWAGEQAGYAEAANADGQMLFAWMSVGDTRVCADRDLLASFPPMALSDWPTSPGAGDTECSMGCRCTWDTWGAVLPADYVPQLSEDQSTLLGTLADRQLQALADLMPDAAYLD